MREEIFLLAYFSKGGFGYAVNEMEAEERAWFLKRLTKQKKEEAAAMKKGTKGNH